MYNVTLLIKPASGLCNLKCKYCFYYDVMDHRDITQYGKMSLATLEVLVQRVYEERRRQVNFIFQGGEPTLVGLPFYQAFIQYVKKYNKQNIPTIYSIQTNGILIDAAFARFFKEHNFLVGISIDGSEKLHNTFRLNNKLEGSFKQVQKGLNYLKQLGVEYNILTVVNSITVKHTEEVYRYLSNLGTSYLQFIPCIDSFEGTVEDHTLQSDDYLEFLKRLFDVWYRDFQKGKRVSIRYFEDILLMLLGRQPSSCTQFGQCTSYQVIEADGSVYPCDFYMLDEWLLGNIYDTSLDELSISKKAIEFIQSSTNKNKDCLKCKYYQICRGGCRRNKEPFENIEDKKTKFCTAFYAFFDYSIERFEEMAHVLYTEQQSSVNVRD